MTIGKQQQVLLIIVVIGILGMVLFLIKGKESPKDRVLAPSSMTGPPKTLPRMANMPLKKKEAPLPAPEYSSNAPMLKKAREALRESIPPKEAVALAKSLPDSPERADAAFLLLEYAADLGDSDAAFLVAQYYDPLQKKDCGSIHKNANTALGWYQDAGGGVEKANASFLKLRNHLEEQAQKGDLDAETILKNWSN